MNAWMLTLVLAATGDVSVVTPTEAHAVLAREVQTGSLLVSRGDCLAVKVYSANRFTHVATVVVQPEGIFCYDAAGGVGVRKQTLAEYIASQREASLHPFHPCQALSPRQQARLTAHLESQLGRPYAISHHLTGSRAAGLHCAEYATDGLIACNLLRARQPSRVSPASLVEGILKADVYRMTDTLQLAPEPPPRPTADNWCHRLWLDTCQCSSLCYLRLRAWFCCK